MCHETVVTHVKHVSSFQMMHCALEFIQPDMKMNKLELAKVRSAKNTKEKNRRENFCTAAGGLPSTSCAST